MRVYELAKELDMGSSELIPLLREMGVEVKAPTSGVPADKVEAIKSVIWAASLAATGEEHSPAEEVEATEPVPVVEPTVEAGTIVEDAQVGVRQRTLTPHPQAPPYDRPGYRLVRKGSVTAGAVRVKKGGMIGAAVYATLPQRVRRFFDQV